MSEPRAPAIGALDAAQTTALVLSTLSGEALDALGVLIAVLADNEMFLGLRIATWATGAPTLEAAVACAAVCQDKLGYSRALYPLLDELPLSQVGVAHPADDPRRRYAMSYFHQPFVDWGQVVAALNLVSPAINLLFQAASRSNFAPLARRAQHILGEEQLTSVYAKSLARDLIAIRGGHEILQRQVDALLPEVLCWFGPPGEPGFTTLVEAGLIGAQSREQAITPLTNERLRQSFIAQIAPLLEELGIATSLQRDETDDSWRYEALPWNSWNGRHRRLEEQ